MARSASATDSKEDTTLLESVLGQTKPSTFLPDWYMDGWMFVFPVLFALGCFLVVMLVSSGVVEFEDANDNGIPDQLEPWAHRGRQAGFTTSTNFTVPSRAMRDDDPKD